MTIEDFVADISQHPRGSALLVTGNFKSDLASLEVQVSDKDIAAPCSMAGLKDMSCRLLPGRKPWLRDGRTCSMLHLSYELRSRTNYILGIDRLLHNVAVWDARHNIDHYLVLGFLCGAVPSVQLRYLGKRTRFIIKSLKTPDGINYLLPELWGGVPKPPWQEHPLQAWFSLETWRLVNIRIVAHRIRYGAQWSSRTLSRQIKASIQEDRRQMAAKARSVM